MARPRTRARGPLVRDLWRGGAARPSAPLRRAGARWTAGSRFTPSAWAMASARWSACLFRDITARREAERRCARPKPRRSWPWPSPGSAPSGRTPKPGWSIWMRACASCAAAARPKSCHWPRPCSACTPMTGPGCCRPWKPPSPRPTSGGGGFEVDYRILWPDGSEHWHAANGQVEFEGEGRRRHQASVLGTALDITVRKQAEAILREADPRKDEFLATLAHELRNPLATIRNGARSSSAPMPRPRWTRRASRPCSSRQVEHMVRLVDDLMEVSRITRGVIELKLSARLRRRAAQCRGSRPPRRHPGRATCWTLQPADGPLPVLGDAVRLAQILGNLLAQRGALHRSGRPHRRARAARCRRHPRRRARHRHRHPARASGAALRAVRPVRQERAALVGRARHRARHRARKLAQMHGGDVQRRQPRPGLGSTFTVTLPASDAPPRPTTRKAGPAPAQPGARAGGG